MPKYTYEELKIIREGYADPNIRVKEIAKHLNRNPVLISIKAKNLGLRKKRKHQSSEGYCCSTCGIKLVKDKNWWKSYYRRNRYTCSDCVGNRNKERMQKLRQKVINIFGGTCIKCGFSDVRALQIDHIKGGGRRELKKFKGHHKFYLYILSLSDKERREKYQLLCANCNKIKQFENNEF